MSGLAKPPDWIMDASKAAYTGPDRAAYASGLDRLLDSLMAKYGSRILVDHAYKIIPDLESGRGSIT